MSRPEQHLITLANRIERGLKLGIAYDNEVYLTKTSASCIGLALLDRLGGLEEALTWIDSNYERTLNLTDSITQLFQISRLYRGEGEESILIWVNATENTLANRGYEDPRPRTLEKLREIIQGGHYYVAPIVKS